MLFLNSTSKNLSFWEIFQHIFNIFLYSLPSVGSIYFVGPTLTVEQLGACRVRVLNHVRVWVNW